MGLNKENKARVVHGLKKAYGLIRNPKHWVKNTSSVPLEGGGTAYCMTGAVSAADNVYAPVMNKQLLKVINQAPRKFTSVVDFNDFGPRTHKRVLSTFRKAIELTENTKV